MATFPGAIYPTPTLQDGVDTIQAAHPNTLGAEINAIETALGVSPSAISDNVAVSSSPANVAAFLDMVATRLRQIMGVAGWTDTVPASLASLSASRITAPSGAKKGDILYHDGTGWVRLPISEKSAALLGIDNGVPGWRLIDARPWLLSPASAAEGGIMTYSAGDWASLPAGVNGTRLTMVNGVPAWAPTIDVMAITQPATYESLARSWIQYPTIQQAIDSVPGGSTTCCVVIPPGMYTEDVAAKAACPVVELVPGTVTINGTVTLGGGSVVRIHRIRTRYSYSAGHAGYGLVMNDTVSTSPAYAEIGEIELYQKLADAGMIVHEGIRILAGVAVVRVGRWSNQTDYQCTVRWVNVLGGVLRLQNTPLVTNMATGWAAFEQIVASGGTLFLHGGALLDEPLATAIKQSGTGTIYVSGVAFNRAQVIGKLNQLRGDRASRNYASAAFFNSAT